jgi:hypothetical protein
MTEAEVVQQMIQHCDSLFPKTCPNCQRIFPTLKDYLQNTVRLGKAVSYDMDVNDFKPADPMGAIATATCRCGTTLALSSDGLPLLKLWRMMIWGKCEAHRRRITPQALLVHLCDELCQQVLGRPGS